MSISAFVMGRLLAQNAGITDPQRANTYGLISAVSGSSLLGTVVTQQLALREAASTPTTAPAGGPPATTPKVPDAPTKVTAAHGPGQASVNWTPPGKDGGAPITAYAVTPYAGQTAGVPVKVASPSTGVTVAGLTNGTAYTFQVAAINIAGTGPSTVSNEVTPVSQPGAPTGVTASAGDSGATVSWTEPADNGGAAILGYLVWPIAGTVGHAPTGAMGTDTTATVSALDNGTSYTFEVTAINRVGGGPPGISNAVTPGVVPDRPTGIKVDPRDKSAVVSWTAGKSGTSPIRDFIVTPYTDKTPGADQPVPAGKTSVVVSGLQNGTEYTFHVVARNDVGRSEPGVSDPVTPTGPVSAAQPAAKAKAEVRD